MAGQAKGRSTDGRNGTSIRSNDNNCNKMKRQVNKK